MPISSETPVIYIPDFVENPDEVFNRLLNLEWVNNDLPRKEYYCNDTPVPYTYGNAQFPKTYFPNVYTDDILNIRKKLESVLDTNLDVCFLNRYDGLSDHIGWHADDSPEMDDNRPIVTVSLGVARKIMFKKRPMPLTDVERLSTQKVVIEDLMLEVGSACVMLPGMQDTHLHKIPKHDRVCGTRISLTFRGYVKS